MQDIQIQVKGNEHSLDKGGMYAIYHYKEFQNIEKLHFLVYCNYSELINPYKLLTSMHSLFGEISIQLYRSCDHACNHQVMFIIGNELAQPIEINCSKRCSDG